MATTTTWSALDGIEKLQINAKGSLDRLSDMRQHSYLVKTGQGGGWAYFHSVATRATAKIYRSYKAAFKSHMEAMSPEEKQRYADFDKRFPVLVTDAFLAGRADGINEKFVGLRETLLTSSTYNGLSPADQQLFRIFLNEWGLETTASMPTFFTREAAAQRTMRRMDSPEAHRKGLESILKESMYLAARTVVRTAALSFVRKEHIPRDYELPQPTSDLGKSALEYFTAKNYGGALSLAYGLFKKGDYKGARYMAIKIGKAVEQELYGDRPHRSTGEDAYALAASVKAFLRP